MLAAFAGCSSADETEVRGASIERPTPPTTPLPAAPPIDDPEASPPGALIAAHPLGRDVVPVGANGWELSYRSTDATGQPIEVTGVVYAPDQPVPAGGRPVLTWAHGPTGVADRCAPTRAGVDVPYADSLIAAGWVVVATDYEGLGTQGPHPFMVGPSAAHTVLDIVRAAGQIEASGAGTRVIAAGHFQGGQAVLQAGMLAADYAPDLELLGIVTGAPTAEVDMMMGGTSGVPELFGYFAMAASGYVETYDDLALDDLLTPDAIDRMEILEEGCTSEILAEFADTPIDDLIVQAPQDSKPWVARMAENQIVHGEIDVPLLILHGIEDDVIPVEFTDGLVVRLCEAGRTMQYRRVAGGGHRDMYDSEEVLVLNWLDNRLNRQPARSTC